MISFSLQWIQLIPCLYTKKYMAAEILSDDDNSSYYYRVFYYVTDAMQAVYVHCLT